MKTAVSLFSGCGGSDAGLIAAGFEILMANDILPYAKEVYLANLPETDYQCCDLAEVNSFPRADLLVGCYPCQGFSQGGARKSDRRINYLYRQFDRALRQILPRVFIVENVSGIKRSDFNHLLCNQVTRFRLAGYRVEVNMLNAAEYGVPQERRRIFIVGVRSDLGMCYEFPDPSHGPGRSKAYWTIGDAIGGMPEWPEGEFFDDKFHWYYLSRNRWRAWDEVSRTIVSHPRHIPLHPLSPRLRRVHTDKWEWEHNGPKRRFSYNEAARLQGFWPEFTLPNTPGIRKKYQVIGNAVPPPLFEAVVKALPDIW